MQPTTTATVWDAGAAVCCLLPARLPTGLPRHLP